MDGGDLVFFARLRAGLSQAALGQRAGVAQNAISRIERGDVDPSFKTVRRLVRASGFELQIDLAARDESYSREIRRRLQLTPRQRLDRTIQLVHTAQATRRAALEDAHGHG